MAERSDELLDAQRPPAAAEDGLLWMLLGARSLALRLAGSLERHAPPTAADASRVHAGDTLSDEVACWLGLLALAARVTDRTDALATHSPAAPPRDLPPLRSASGSLLR